MTLNVANRAGLVANTASPATISRSRLSRHPPAPIVHFHDLRHTGNTLAATGGATTRELMQRMGHSSVRAALIYQHLVNGRDHAIAAHVDEQIKRVRPAEPSADGPEEASGT